MSKLISPANTQAKGVRFYFTKKDLEASGFKSGDEMKKEVMKGTIILTLNKGG